MPLPAILSALLPSLITAGIGGLASLFSSGSGGGGLGGAPAKVEQLPRFNPNQTAGLDQVLRMALGGIPNIAKGFDFGPIEEQARTGFMENTIPSIAERFTAMGGQRSSAFPQILGQAGAGLERSLAALKSDVGLRQQGNQQNLLLSLLQAGLQPRSENLYHQRVPGFLESSLPGLGSLFGSQLNQGLSGLSGLGSTLDSRANVPTGGCSGGSCSINRNAPISGQTSFGSNYGGFGTEFTNPNLYSPGLTNLLNMRF